MKYLKRLQYLKIRGRVGGTDTYVASVNVDSQRGVGENLGELPQAKACDFLPLGPGLLGLPPLSVGARLHPGGERYVHRAPCPTFIPSQLPRPEVRKLHRTERRVGHMQEFRTTSHQDVDRGVPVRVSSVPVGALHRN